jgi:esterase/lipase superfamily enzyme
MTTIYFATNRKKDGTGDFGYGGSMVDLDDAAVTYAIADVTGVKLTDEASGKIKPLKDLTAGNFSDAAQQAIVNSGRDVLVFVHGASNTFEDAIRRAAFNCEWFADADVDAAKTTVVAFTWPSAAINIGDTLGGYRRDQNQAGKSGQHLRAFFKNILALRGKLKAANPQARVFLLAHSMGNHALQAGVRSWAEAGGLAQLIFDQVFHAAPDEVAETYQQDGLGMRPLTGLSDRISIYYSREDRLMWASAAANNNQRLGFNGPSEKMNTGTYPRRKFRIVDCTRALDFSLLIPWDASHQYYRRSEAVREDIAACMVDDPRPPGGLSEISTIVVPDPVVA